jgi:nicotinate-nucleotide pyrophosphorylase
MSVGSQPGCARRAHITIQAPGGVTPETARAYAQAVVALLSLAVLTHSPCAAPIRCDVTVSS